MDGYTEEELPEYLKGKGKRYKEHTTSLAEGQVDKKDEKLWTKLQTKVTKANRLQEENRRILAKEGGSEGLTDGQREHVARNDQRIQQLTDEVQCLTPRDVCAGPVAGPWAGPWGGWLQAAEV